LEFLSDGLEGRSRNPISLLIDNLIHPDADLGAHLQSKVKWRHDPTLSIDHICLGRGGIGGVWNQLTSKQFQTISMADWMELPNYPMSTFRQQRQAYQNRLSKNNKPINNNTSLRATYEEVRSYYMHYVKRNHLTNYFRNGCEVTSVQRVCINTPFYDEETEEIRTPEALWEIRGYDKQNQNSFIIHAKYVVLATGIPQEVTKPLGIIGEQASRSFTYTNLNSIEELITKKELRKDSKPLLVIGCGLTAIDVLFLCQQYSIPVLHVFRRALDDHELALNQLSSTMYPEYERIKELIRQTSTSSEWSYQCCSQSEVVSITEDGTVHIRNLRTQITTDYDISFVARLTGAEMKIPFLKSLTTNKKNSLHINPYTYECTDFDNMYALGALAGDKLVRFLQGGAIACAANLFKKRRQTISNKRLSFGINSRTRIIV
jgi:thioredoxin reductase